MCKVIKIGLISERVVTSVDCQDDRDSAAAGHPEGAQWLGDPDHHQPQVPGHDPLLLQGQVPHRLEAQQGRGRQLRRAAEEASWTRVSFHHHIQLVFCKFKILCMVNETQVKRFLSSQAGYQIIKFFKVGFPFQALRVRRGSVLRRAFRPVWLLGQEPPSVGSEHREDDPQVRGPHQGRPLRGLLC